MQTVKDTKRRVVQLAAEKLGKAERESIDAQTMKEAQENFKTLEQELKTLLGHINTVRLEALKYVEKTQQLGDFLSQFYVSDSELSPLTNNFSTSISHVHQAVAPSVNKAIDVNCIRVVENLLQERIPQIKTKIHEYVGVELDVSSYTRRVKTLTEQKKEQDAAKFKEKLDKKNVHYRNLHEEILRDLSDLQEQRHSLIKSVYIALMVANQELTQEVLKALQISTKNLETNGVKKEIENYISSGDYITDSPKPAGAGLGIKSLLIKGTATMRRGSNSSLTPPSVKKPGPALTVPSSPLNTTSYNFKNRMKDEEDDEPERSNPPPPPPPPPPSSSSQAQAKSEEAGTPLVSGTLLIATYEYAGDEDNDLSFQEGDQILFDKQVDEGWWLGTKVSDETYGLFPSNHVEVLHR